MIEPIDYVLSLMLAIRRAQADGFHHFAAALEAELKTELALNKRD